MNSNGHIPAEITHMERVAWRMHCYSAGTLFWRITATVLLLAFAIEIHAGVIDRIVPLETPGQSGFRVLFNVPLLLVNYAPRTASDDLAIQLRPAVMTPYVAESVIEPSTVVNPHTTIPVTDATYRAVSAERGVLDIRFSKTVDYEVQQGEDQRSLIVYLLPQAATGSGNSRLDTAKTESGIMDGDQQTPVYMFGPDTPYVINLESSVQPLEKPSGQALPGLEDYLVYSMSYEIDRAIWHQLRLGFFKSRKDAENVLARIKERFPRALVTRAREGEIGLAMNERGTRIQSSQMTRSAEREEVTDPVQPPVPPQRKLPAATGTVHGDRQITREKTSDERIADLMEQARQAMALNNLDRAIRLYTKILEYPEHPYTQDALEFLALARERKGQIAHAKAEYERYLELFPDSEGADRVQQRLTGLITAGKQPVESRQPRQMARNDRQWDVFGGFSQFYRHASSVTDDQGNDTNVSALSSDLDITGRRRGTRYDLQTRFTGSYAHDFLSDGPGSESSVSTLYIDGADHLSGFDMRLGRQSRNTGGVLGRFDGLLLGYKLTDWMTINTVAGFPVESTDNNMDTGRKLYGLSADWGTFADAWDFNTFIIEQKVDHIVDRRSVGGEIRYFDSVRSLLAFADYDISYKDLNTLILLGTWILPKGTTINASFDYRNSPVLTTTNALQGQSAGSIGELENLFSESEIRQLAEDRTADVKTVTGGVSHPVTERFQISADVTATTLSATVESGNVEAVPGTGWEYFYNLQFIGSGLLKQGDISVLGFRYTDADNANTSSVTLNNRYPINRQWRINPRLRVDYRDNDDGTSQWLAGSSFRTDYRWQKRYRIELEAGAERISQKLEEDDSKTTSYFMSLGYRYDF